MDDAMGRVHSAVETSDYKALAEAAGDVAVLIDEGAPTSRMTVRQARDLWDEIAQLAAWRRRWEQEGT
jgi:hypothetical protein